MTGLYGRYLLGWAIVGALLLLALLTVFPGVAGDSGRAATVAGVSVCAAVDLMVFAIVLRALAAPQERFAKLWGLSVFLKAAIIGGAIAAVAVAGWFPIAGFVQVLVVSFIVFAHHEILWLALRPRPGRPMLIPWSDEHAKTLNVQEHVKPHDLLHFEKFGLNLSITNLTVMAVIAGALLLLMARGAARKRGVVPHGILENAFEGVVLFVRDDLVRPTMGHDGDKFVHYFCTLFTFILLANLLGIVPIPGIGGTATANTGMTWVLAGSVVITGIVFAIKENGVGGFIKSFVPSGVPFWLVPVLFVLEVFSFAIKHVILGVRLCINMVAGHLVLGAFIAIIIAAQSYVPAGPVVVAGLFVSALELLVCLIQAFVFTLLSVLFIGGMVHPDH